MSRKHTAADSMARTRWVWGRMGKDTALATNYWAEAVGKKKGQHLGISKGGPFRTQAAEKLKVQV